MPITFNVSSSITPSSKAPNSHLTSHVQIFDGIWGKKQGNKYEELLQSTFSGPGLLGPNQAQAQAQAHAMHDIGMVKQNGFIETVVDAYNRHYNLVIKPDDIWIAILTQFNLYVNAHSEELRSQFVAHEGQKELVIEDVGTRYTISFAKLALAFTREIQENVVDPDLQSWILPDFTTTTFNDTVVCSVLMMSTLKSYFSYTARLSCGIPNVTLLGEKEDWEKLLGRLGKLETFGEEPAAWASLLRPVLMRFVDAFDGNYHTDFWSKICHIRSGSGMSSLSGWITSFCVWDKTGKWKGPALPLPDPTLIFEVGSGSEGPIQRMPTIPPLHKLSMYHLPPAICDVDVKLDDNGEVFDCIMVAGHVGNVTMGASRDTLGMVPAWFMAIKNKADQSDTTHALVSDTTK